MLPKNILPAKQAPRERALARRQVYRCSAVGSALGVRQLIGFRRRSVRELLAIGVAIPDAHGHALESVRNNSNTVVWPLIPISRVCLTHHYDIFGVEKHLPTATSNTNSRMVLSGPGGDGQAQPHPQQEGFVSARVLPQGRRRPASRLRPPPLRRPRRPGKYERTKNTRARAFAPTRSRVASEN